MKVSAYVTRYENTPAPRIAAVRLYSKRQVKFDRTGGFLVRSVQAIVGYTTDGKFRSVPLSEIERVRLRRPTLAVATLLAAGAAVVLTFGAAAYLVSGLVKDS